MLNVSENSISGIYTGKFHLLDHTEDLQEFCTLFVLETSRIEQYNVHIKHACRQTSRRWNTCMNERVMRLGGGVDGLETDSTLRCSEGERDAEKFKIDRLLQYGAYLRRGGEEMSFTRISSVLRESQNIGGRVSVCYNTVQNVWEGYAWITCRNYAGGAGRGGLP